MSKGIISYILLIIGSCFVQLRAQSVPILWNMERLRMMKVGTEGHLLKKSIQEHADAFLQLKPITVTDKSDCFSGDKHNYESVSIYFWQDSLNPNGPYIVKDGVVNPIYKKYDGRKLELLTERLMFLSLQLFLTSEEKYYDCFIKQLRCWFLDDSTYMKPNFNYAQIMIGHNSNYGAVHGIIDFYSSLRILESIRLVDYCHGIDADVMQGLKKWFRFFANWMETTNKKGKIIEMKSNISIAYYVILYNIYLFVGEILKAKGMQPVLNTLINSEIDEEGRQPAELKRSKAFFYSIYNLTHIFDYCILSKNCGLDVYENISKRVEKAVLFLYQFVGHREEFPYQEMSNWQINENALRHELNRMTLFSNSQFARKYHSEKPSPFFNINYILK